MFLDLAWIWILISFRRAFDSTPVLLVPFHVPVFFSSVTQPFACSTTSTPYASI